MTDYFNVDGLLVSVQDEEARRMLERVRAEEERTGWAWRYLRTGKQVHALRVSTTGLDRVAGCGMAPPWYEGWLGTGSQVEYETAAGAPKCRRCARKVVEAS